ncbi:hypothetical protein KO506_12290 [Polaribacter vadi]|uniref:hypothetical protein n=1 Tax=Polaribacter TaxID=52959 RepID=UPI001C09460C|nr:MULTISPECIES: hypothetical protein [Polaribacter]MBU3012187.1 hypothetical protein [Polaribacter vadi]MDO6742003.1 hypothetical protein [Polaribacter sp. 1_MG-2023]
MKKIRLIIIISILNLNFGFSQTKSEIDLLLNGISETENSKEITKTKQAKKIIAFGENSLKILSEFFTDSSLTKIKSECQKRNLTKGELAIIVADRIENMPYFQLTGIQNCLLEFCEGNPNLIEYYLPSIKDLGIEKFKKKYVEWLFWRKLSKREKRKIERNKKREYKRKMKELEKKPAGNTV